jgi:hypothetical protein
MSRARCPSIAPVAMWPIPLWEASASCSSRYTATSLAAAFPPSPTPIEHHAKGEKLCVSSIWVRLYMSGCLLPSHAETLYLIFLDNIPHACHQLACKRAHHIWLRLLKISIACPSCFCCCRTPTSPDTGRSLSPSSVSALPPLLAGNITLQEIFIQTF